MNEGNGNIDQATQNLLAIAQAINAQTQVQRASFPQASVVSNTAGASAGKYLTIIAADGTPYKIALLLP